MGHQGPRPVDDAPARPRPDASPALERLLLEVSRSTASHRDLRSLLCDLVALMQKAVRFDRLGLVLHDPVGDVMRLHSIAAFHPPLTTCHETPISESPAGLVWQTQEPLVVPAIERETRFSEV